MVLPDSHGVSRAPRYSGSGPRHSHAFRLRGCYPLRPTVPGRSARRRIWRGGPARPPSRIPQPHRRNACRLTRRRFGLFPLRSPLLRESLLISCPPATEMFQFTGWPPTCLCVQQAVMGLHPIGFPHSDIPGSKPVCGSPRLFAACHVLHRPKAPRHPPHALVPLTAPGSIPLSETALARVPFSFRLARGSFRRRLHREVGYLA